MYCESTAKNHNIQIFWLKSTHQPYDFFFQTIYTGNKKCVGRNNAIFMTALIDIKNLKIFLKEIPFFENCFWRVKNVDGFHIFLCTLYFG